MRDTVEEPTSTAIRERGGLGTEEEEWKKEEATHDHRLYIYVTYIILQKRLIEYILYFI